jgi:hypothetical protein
MAPDARAGHEEQRNRIVRQTVSASYFRRNSQKPRVLALQQVEDVFHGGEGPVISCVTHSAVLGLSLY